MSISWAVKWDPSQDGCKGPTEQLTAAVHPSLWHNIPATADIGLLACDAAEGAQCPALRPVMISGPHFS